MRIGPTVLALSLHLSAIGLIASAAMVPAQAQRRSTVPDTVAAMKADYKRPPARRVEHQALVDLGRLLFWDPRVSASGGTACVSCHLPHLGWAATDARSRNDSGKLTSRKSPTLLGLGHATDTPLGWDGRNPTLEAQAKGSITTGAMSMRETAAPVKVEDIEQRVRNVPAYAALFNTAFRGGSISIDSIASAIAAYERTMEPGPAPFDRWIDGDERAISEAAKRGFVLFNTKANCSVCHVGWRFTDDGFHDIGTSTGDLGRGRELKDIPAMQYAFKTPTLRSVALRPPYMHNASAATLYAVIEHYERGGIDRPSRSPEIFPLQDRAGATRSGCLHAHADRRARRRAQAGAAAHAVASSKFRHRRSDNASSDDEQPRHSGVDPRRGRRRGRRRACRRSERPAVSGERRKGGDDHDQGRRHDLVPQRGPYCAQRVQPNARNGVQSRDHAARCVGQAHVRPSRGRRDRVCAASADEVQGRGCALSAVADCMQAPPHDALVVLS
jgi:cytochrome c peroxidase